MKLYDIYLTRQAKYNEYVVLIESGMFVDAYDKDANILNKLLQYKMVPGNQFIKVGFPKKNLNKVLLVLESKSVNYLVLDSNNNIFSRKKFKNNNYSLYCEDISKITDIQIRIRMINDKLKNKIKDNNIESIISKIEELL